MFIPRARARLLLVGIAGILLVACHKKGTAQRPSLAEARELPFEQQQSFVRLGRELRTIRCVRTLDWSHPDVACVNAVQGCASRVEAATTADLIDLPADKFPLLHDYARFAVYLREDLQLMQTVFGTPLGMRPYNVEVKLIQAAGKASDIADSLDGIFGLDDPGWNLEAAPEPGPKPAAPPPKAAPSPSVPPPEAASETPEAKPTPAPASDTPEAKPAPAPAAAPTALGLTRTLQEMLAKLEAAGHDAGRISEVPLTVRPQLERLDASLRDYRSEKRGETETEAAARFADQASRARNKVSKALGEMSAAARRVITTILEPGESAFGEADRALEQARAEVALAEEASRKAP